MESKILIEELPTDDEPVQRRRILQPRGEIAFLENGESFLRLSYCTLKAGKGFYRGGHYHERKAERVYVMTGRIVVSLADLDTGEKGKAVLREGMRAIIRPRLAHRFVAEEDARFIEYCDQVYDPADDLSYDDF